VLSTTQEVDLDQVHAGLTQKLALLTVRLSAFRFIRAAQEFDHGHHVAAAAHIDDLDRPLHFLLQDVVIIGLGHRHPADHLLFWAFTPLMGDQHIRTEVVGLPVASIGINGEAFLHPGKEAFG
jgi:hypothetical protein